MTKKIKPIRIIRAVIQLISFIFAPALFATILSSLGDTFIAIFSGEFTLSAYIGKIILVLSIFAITFIWGRFFCGFICSFGAMQDLLNLIGSIFPFKLKIPEKTDKWMKFIKYFVLLFIIIGVWGFSVTGDVIWSPWTVFGIYSSISGWATLKYFLTLGGILLLLIIIGSLFIERFFCKYLCPLGAIFAVISKFRIFKIKRKKDTCGSCKVCTNKCSMSIPLYKYEKVTSGECINCMQCTQNCPRKNITTNSVAAISGTLAVSAVTGLYCAGVINLNPKTEDTKETPAIIETIETGDFKDGTYTGTGEGFRGTTKVSVTVKNGYISEINVTSYKDDDEYFSRCKSKIINSVISNQSTDVDTVSGATYSSKGLINAIKDALKDQLPSQSIETKETTPSTSATEKETQPRTEIETEEEEMSGIYTDGVYSATGTGFRGDTSVTVTVENGNITDITIDYYQDDDRFFNAAVDSVISDIINTQSIDVDTVSGATFSSNGIKEAVANALGIEFDNPNQYNQHDKHKR